MSNASRSRNSIGIHFTMRCTDSVLCLSVCLSVTLVDHDPPSSTRQTCHCHLQFGPSMAVISVSIPTFSKPHQMFLSYATLIPTVLIGQPRQNKKKRNTNIAPLLWLIYMDDLLHCNPCCSLVFPSLMITPSRHVERLKLLKMNKSISPVFKQPTW